jgi:hypothetical protein
VPFHFVHIVKPRLEQSIRLAALVGASLGLAIAAGNVAGAAGARSERPEARAAGEPIMAIVSLRRQQITIYDAEGGILRAPGPRQPLHYCTLVQTLRADYEIPGRWRSVAHKGKYGIGSPLALGRPQREIRDRQCYIVSAPVYRRVGLSGTAQA